MLLDPSNPRTATVLDPFLTAPLDQFNAHPDELNPTTIPLPTGYTLVRNIQMSDILGGTATPEFFGFLAAGPDMQVIALRGTDTLTEWIDDAEWALVPFTNVANGGNVVQGFFDIYRTMTTSVPGQAGTMPGISDLPKAVTTTPKLVVTGHSLGGVLTTLMVPDLLANTSLKPEAWGFASPKVGDAVFAAKYASLTTTSWRFYNSADLATYIPFGIDYEHVNAGFGFDSRTFEKWSIPCAHAVDTYMHGIDSQWPIPPGCQ